MTSSIICLSPYSGGMEIDSLKLAKLLSENIKIIFILKKGTFLERNSFSYANKNIDFISIDFEFKFGLKLIFALRKIVKEKKINNIIFFGASELKSMYFAFLGLDINLIIRHGTTKSHSKKDIFHRLIYKNVNYHIAICKHIKENVKKIIPIAKNSKLKLIYSSLDLNLKAKKLSQKKVKILQVARLAKGKGIEDSMKACFILEKNNIDFSFDIIGSCDDKKYEEALKKFLAKLTYRDKINFLGYKADIYSYIQNYNIFLFPSYGEGLSNSFLEGLYSGLICLSYDNTSFPELKDLGFDFFIAKDRDIDDLSNKLLYISKNLAKNLIKVEKNIQLSKELFSHTREKEEFLNLLLN